MQRAASDSKASTGIAETGIMDSRERREIRAMPAISCRVQPAAQTRQLLQVGKRKELTARRTGIVTAQRVRHPEVHPPHLPPLPRAHLNNKAPALRQFVQ